MTSEHLRRETERRRMLRLTLDARGLVGEDPSWAMADEDFNVRLAGGSEGYCHVMRQTGVIFVEFVPGRVRPSANEFVGRYATFDEAAEAVHDVLKVKEAARRLRGHSWLLLENKALEEETVVDCSSIPRNPGEKA